MRLLTFKNRLLMVAGLFILSLSFFTETYFAKEMSVKTDNPQISSKEINDISITEAEIKIMMNKLASARDLLDSFWRENFARQNLGYISPKTVAFTDSVNTPCGVIGRGNAAYCIRSHSIYFDVNFFARMMKLTALNLNTDGDMAVISVLAHEWGHAVQYQAKMLNKLPIMNELQADCLSGAFARYATEKGVLEEGDTKEAAFAFAIGGDNAPWYAPQAHGDSRMRVERFSLGFQNGITGCR